MAALSTEGFQEAQPGGLDLFSLPPTMTCVERIYYDEQRSTSQLSGNSPIEFFIAAQNSLEYIDLMRSKLYLKTRIKHANGDSLKATECVGPVNNFLHSMFSQIDVSVQNKLITSSTTHYPYKAFIQNTLFYTNDAKKSQLTSQLYMKDAAGHCGDKDVQNGANASLCKRSLYFARSQMCDMEEPLLHDLFDLY
jgi:hypothetical protein